ncbi:DHA2 family efflux MFS transporter permease subunit [Umezawaea tangerina]|uniref:EmrB/QacA subfamily drug resistance transporter n=1 Tax=Umezawaea tangerina TaxID=84725 RepID=A0A2T0STZ3_9PSEU|nr:DHA2 family efflux MFS transporter permease subunit [Umezawaea tangerina]PRY36891.1 EmrB/QacA subfamily drug resistance transporter [Umezawaea tangerina]
MSPVTPVEKSGAPAASAAPTTGVASDGGRRPVNRWLALVVLSLAQLMVVLDSTIVNIALPTAQHDLGFSADGRQWVVTGYALAFGSLLLLGGRLSDHFGRRRVFVVGVVGFAAASALGGAAGGLAVLLVARVAQGVFAALLAPAALSMVAVAFADDPAERGRAFGVFGAISGAGGALGLLLGGVLTQGLSWRWCLYVNLVIAGVAFVGALLFLPATGRPERTRFDVAGTVTAVLGLVGVVYGLGNAASTGWTDVRTVGPTVAGVLLMAVFVLVERRVRDPLLPLPVILDRDRGAAYLAVGISGTGGFAVFLFLTYYLAETLGFSPVRTGVAFLPMVGLIMVGAVFSGAVLLPRTGPRPVVAAGCLLAAVGMALLTGIGVDSTYASGVLPSLLVIGLGLGLVFGPGQNAATSGVGPHETGAASAMVNIAQQVGGSIGLAVFSSLGASAVAGHLAAHPATAADPAALVEATLAGYHLVFRVAAALFLGGAVLAAVLFRGGPLPTNPDAPPVSAH